MTVQEVYYGALALLGEPKSSAGDYEDDVVIGKVNVLIWELWPYHQAVRTAKGEAEDGEPQVVSGMSEEIGMEEKVLRLPMTYGLASGLAYDDDETGKAAFFNDKMAELLAKAIPAVIGEIEDVY